MTTQGYSPVTAPIPGASSRTAGNRVLSRRSPGDIDVYNNPYNAVGDGVAYDDDALEAALLAASREEGGTVYIRSGTLRCARPKTIPDGVTLKLAPDATITFFGAEPALFTGIGCILMEGSIERISDLADPVAVNATTVDFNIAPGLSADDVLILQSTVDFSYNPARNYYRTGTMLEVVSTSAASATVAIAIEDAYTVVNTECYVMNTVRCGLVGGNIIGIGTDSGVAVVTVRHGRKCEIRDVNLTGSQLALILLDRCFQTTVRSVVGYDYGPIADLNYGVAVANCRDVLIDRCQLSVVRHAVTIGGADLPAAVVNRHVRVTNCRLTGTYLYGADAHGNSCKCVFDNNTIENGVVMGGVDCVLRNCEVSASPSDGRFCYVSDLTGSLEISGNHFRAVRHAAGSPQAFMTWDNGAPEDITRPNTRIRIANNVFELGAYQGSAWFLRSRATRNDIDFEVEGNKVIGDNLGTDYAASVAAFGTSRLRSVILRHNVSTKGMYVDNTGAERIAIIGNEVSDAELTGLRTDGEVTVPWDWQYISCYNNKVIRSGQTGISLGGNELAKCSAQVCNNESFDNARAGTGSTITRCSILATRFTSFIVRGNLIGDSLLNQYYGVSYYNVVEAIVGRNEVIGQNLINYTALNAGGSAKHTQDELWGQRGAATAEVALRLGKTQTEGYEHLAIAETVDCSAAAASHDLSQDVPVGSIIKGVLTNNEAAITGAGGAVRIGIGVLAAPDKYGIATLAKNQKISEVFVGTKLAVAEDVQLFACDAAGNALGTIGGPGESARVYLVYQAPNPLDDAP